MKKIVLAGLVALSVMAISQQQASAWVNSKFGVGLNWDVQSGGNQFLWGAWRNGQPPGPEGFGGGAPRFNAPMPQHGYAPQGYPAQGFAPMQQGFPPQGQSPFDASTAEPPFAGGYASPYQFATYPRPVYYYYPNTYYYGR
jgi:hypothetical protein